MKRPTTDGDHGSYCTTPRAASLIQLLGGIRHEAVTISEDERRALERLYGFYREEPRERPPAPIAQKREDFPQEYPGGAQYADAMRAHTANVKTWEKWTDPSPFFQAGADIHMMRHAETDGLRLIAWLAKFCEPGDDPLKVVIEIAASSGLDVDPEDFEYATGEGGEEE